MFAYCENDPVNREDPSGEFGARILSGILSAGISALSACVTGGSTTDIMVAAATGFATGFFKNNTVILAVNAISAIYDGVTTGIESKSVWKGIAAGVVSFGASFVSSSTLNGKKLNAGLNTACSLAFDGTFGFGADLTSNTFQRALMSNNNTTPKHNRQTSAPKNVRQKVMVAKAPKSINRRKAMLM